MSGIEFLQFFIIALINITLIVLGFWIFARDRKNTVNRLFTVLSIFALFWIDFAYIADRGFDFGLSLILIKLNVVCAWLWVVLCYFCVRTVLTKDFSLTTPHKVLIVSAVTFALFIGVTEFVVQTIELESWGADPVFGPGVWILYTGVLLIATLIVLTIASAYRRFLGDEKERLRHFLVGTLMVVFFNAIFSIFIPILRGSYEFYQFGSYSIPLFLILLALLIIRAKVIIMRSSVVIFFIIAILALLLFDIIVLTDPGFLKYLKTLIFLLVVVAGYILFKNAVNEVEKREQIEKITSQIRETNKKLQEAYKQLKELDKAKTEFIAISSQRLRNPLSVTKGYISMILEGTYGSLPGKAEKPMHNIFQANERLIHLVNDLLDISKIESGKLEIIKERIHLHDLLKESVEEQRIEAEKKGLQLSLDNGKDIVLEGDSNKLKQVFSNFIHNAIKYTPKGEIIVSVLTKEDSIVVSVADTGEGMEEKEVRKLFEIFSRGAAGLKLYTEGTGLGLYVAKKIVELHKGKIWAESKGLKKGSTFFVELPYNQS